VKRGEHSDVAELDCSRMRFAIVSAAFYADVAEMLLEGARHALRDCKVRLENASFFEVPGCFELPLACVNLIASNRFDAIVALGAVVRGETSHFDYVAGECARGIMDVQLRTGTPIGFGVLTTENVAQALERADPNRGNKGYAATVAAATLAQQASKLGRM